MKTIFHAIALGFCTMLCASCQESRTVKITVVEEDVKTPVVGAEVRVFFLAYDPSKDRKVAGPTDENGVFVAKGHAPLRMTALIDKPGYYQTKSGRLSRKKDHDLTFVLRRIRNPIALYARKYRGKVPGIGHEYGFDFETGDWVAPHGQGKTADLLFRVDTIEDGNKLAGRIRIQFAGEGEGWIRIGPENGYLPRSEMVMPHEAPENGYKKTLERIEAGYENKAKEPNVSYFFRTREQRAPDGESRFNYSKFKDGFRFMMTGGRFIDESQRSKYPDELAVVEFTYYFNPAPNDRNLEFDPQQNLFKHLKAEEWPHDP
jgi:hypothetical protein